MHSAISVCAEPTTSRDLPTLLYFMYLGSHAAGF